MGDAKRRRVAAIDALAATVGGDTDLATHLYDQQVAPQELTRKLRAEGHNVDVTLVDTSADAKGFEVSCYLCGRTARMPMAPPEGMVVMCPQCQREPR